MTELKTELVTIKPGTELETFATPSGADALIANVRASVMSMDGGSMKNGTTRKKIRSNAYAATKFKTKLKRDHIDPLIASLELQIQPVIDTIDAVKKGEKYINAGFDKIRKDVNEEVDAFEAELQRVADEKAEVERLAQIVMQIELLWDYAHIRLNEFKLAELMTVDYLAYKQRIRDEEIAKVAAEKATIEAERKAQAAIDAAQAAEAKAKQDAIDTENKRVADLKAAAEETERQRQAAIQAEIELEEAEERRLAQVAESKRLADIAETQRVEREKQLAIEAEQRAIQDEAARVEQARLNEAARVSREKQAVADKIESDKQAEIQANAAAEQARLNEVARVEDVDAAKAKVAATREANQQNRSAVHTDIKNYLMTFGISEEVATNVVNDMKSRDESKKMPRVTINY